MLRKDLALVGIMCTILMLMIVPLSQTLIDVFLATNISMAVLLLIVAIYLRNPSDFSTFPSVILIGTAFRLALSIGTTRLILSEADAGEIIETFGEFVVAGSVAIGLVIFLIITVVQFLVVTKGAERVAEVGARFALDALPGKQMSIDADIRAGALDQNEGMARRKQLDRDSQFFGAMDGAMKFVKGDAIAGLIIIVINLIGGVAVGVSIHGYGFSEAVSVYSLLTIGDGLVAQVPALMMSLSAGVIVTRAANGDNTDLGTDIVGELVSDPRVPGVAAFVVLGLGFIPGFPMIVFAATAAGLVLIWAAMRKVVALNEQQQKEEEEAKAAQQELRSADEIVVDENKTARSARFRVLLPTQSNGLIDMHRLQQALDGAFNRLYQVRGVSFPPPHVERFMEADRCQIVLDDVPVYTFYLPSGSGHILLEGSEEVLALTDCPESEAMRVTWINFTGWWVPAVYADEMAELLPTILPEDRMAEQIYRIYERNLGNLLAKQEFQTLITDLRNIDAESTEQLEQQIGHANLIMIMRYLAEDGVPLRPFRLFLDSLVYWVQANEGAGPLLIAECMRGSMKRQLCHSIAGPDNVMGVAMVDPQLETLARQSVAEAKRNGQLNMVDGLFFDSETSEAVVSQFRDLAGMSGMDSSQIAIVVSADVRRRLRNFLSTNDIHLPVLSPHEISSDVTCYPLKIVGASNWTTNTRESREVREARETRPTRARRIRA